MAGTLRRPVLLELVETLRRLPSQVGGLAPPPAYGNSPAEAPC